MVVQSLRLARSRALERAGSIGFLFGGWGFVAEQVPRREWGQLGVWWGLKALFGWRQPCFAASERTGAGLPSRALHRAGGAGAAFDLGVSCLMSAFPLITTLTLVPLIGGFLVIGLPAEQKNLARRLALGVSFVALALALVVWSRFNAAS